MPVPPVESELNEEVADFVRDVTRAVVQSDRAAVAQYRDTLVAMREMADEMSGPWQPVFEVLLVVTDEASRHMASDEWR